MKNMEKLREILGRAADFAAAEALLEWDEYVYMPEGASESRALQIATIDSARHELLTSRTFEKLVASLEKEISGCDPDSDDAGIVRKAARDLGIRRRVPAGWVRRNAALSTRANAFWLKAREKNDYSVFAPHFARLVELRREYSAFFPEAGNPLDPHLDRYEENLTLAELEKIFIPLEREQRRLIRKASEKARPEASFLSADWPGKKQLAFIDGILDRMGYDRAHGRQDLTVHPFTTSFGLDDVRITTKIAPHAPFSALFSSIHECGHALYEQGIAKKFARTPLADGASFSVHESQSRLWENLVGRSPEFWEFALPRMKKTFPELRTVSMEDFLAALNTAAPSAVRTEADELTYNMHIFLRLGLERDLMNGTLSAAEAGVEWNRRMFDLLGVEVRSDKEGVLQDVHWAMGEFGYFPSYALGNILSAQFFNAALRDCPEIPERIAAGDFSVLLGWLRTHVHQYGAKYGTLELLKKSGAGTGIDPKPYLRHLELKYTR